MTRYEKKKDLRDKMIAISISLVVLLFFSIVSAIISLNFPGIIYLFGSIPMNLTYFIFGIFMMIWAGITVILLRIVYLSKNGKKKR